MTHTQPVNIDLSVISAGNSTEAYSHIVNTAIKNNKKNVKELQQ